MKLNNVLISTKQTDLEYARMNYDDVAKEYGEEQHERMIKSNIEHYNALNLIRDTLNTKGIKHQRLYMPYTAHEEFKNKDLVICVGGDGTVLNSARYILDETPVLTVKSESSSVGALCEITTAQFESTLDKILHDEHNIELRTRVEGTFDNKTDHALNEISIAAYYGTGFVRYEINFKGITERISGSGMIISTGAGATGWYKKIPGSDQNFSKKDNYLRFIARDYDYQENHDKYKLSSGAIMPGEILEIRSLNEDGEVISYDSNLTKRMHRFKMGHTIKIKVSDKPLHMVTINNSHNEIIQRDNYDTICL